MPRIIIDEFSNLSTKSQRRREIERKAHKKYYEKNKHWIKDRYKEYNKNWREKNKERLRQKAREHYKKHCGVLRPKKREYMKSYNQENKYLISNKLKRFYEDNKDFIKKYDKIRSYCKYHNLPKPTRKKETWRDTTIRRVARKHNGQFISWKIIKEE